MKKLEKINYKPYKDVSDSDVLYDLIMLTGDLVDAVEEIQHRFNDHIDKSIEIVKMVGDLDRRCAETFVRKDEEPNQPTPKL